ncbi:hypothetical protein C8R46DRAFT_911129, partial [Mycena filopes]
RPQEVPAWMRARRLWSSKVKLSSEAGPHELEGTFANRWWGWWMETQPSGRKKKNGELRAAKDVAAGEWEDISKMAGRNGMLMFVGSLLWWVEGAAGANEDGPASAALAEWKTAVNDVTSVLRAAVKRVVGPSKLRPR